MSLFNKNKIVFPEFVPAHVDFIGIRWDPGSPLAKHLPSDLMDVRMDIIWDDLTNDWDKELIIDRLCEASGCLVVGVMRINIRVDKNHVQRSRKQRKTTHRKHRPQG